MGELREWSTRSGRRGMKPRIESATVGICWWLDMRMIECFLLGVWERDARKECKEEEGDGLVRLELGVM